MIFIGVRNDLGIVPTHPKAQSRPIVASQALENVQLKTFGEYRANPSAQKVKQALGSIPIGGNYSNIKRNLGFNLGKLHPYRCSNTIVKYVSLTGHYSGLTHWDMPRLLTIEELKRLASLPDNFQMIGEFTDQWARIGNSVPPLFMLAIAQHILENILEVM